MPPPEQFPRVASHSGPGGAHRCTSASASTNTLPECDTELRCLPSLTVSLHWNVSLSCCSPGPGGLTSSGWAVSPPPCKHPPFWPHRCFKSTHCTGLPTRTQTRHNCSANMNPGDASRAAFYAHGLLTRRHFSVCMGGGGRDLRKQLKEHLLCSLLLSVHVSEKEFLPARLSGVTRDLCDAIPHTQRSAVAIIRIACRVYSQHRDAHRFLATEKNHFFLLCVSLPVKLQT